MAAFEYDVVSLQQHHEAGDRRCFRWKSRRGGCHDVDYSELEEMLNLRGEQGWQVVAQDSDARFGSAVILMRVKEDAPAKKASKTTTAEIPISAPPIVVSAPPVDLAPLLAELKALRQEVAAQREQELLNRPLDAARRLQEEQRQRQAEEANRYLHSEAFKEALAPILTVLQAKQELQSVTATLAPEAAEQIGSRLERALVQAVEIATAPRLIPAQNVEPKFEQRRPRLSWSWVIGR